MKTLNQKHLLNLLFVSILCLTTNILFGQNNILSPNSNGANQMLKPPSKSSDYSFSQERIPWIKSDLMKPSQLSTEIKNGKASNTLILNVGSVEDIKGAVNFGAMLSEDNMQKFKHYLAKVPKDQSIVIYCGCCPIDVCPNVKPAYNFLKKNGYANFKILNLKDNLNIDWTSKGYPMKK